MAFGSSDINPAQEVLRARAMLTITLSVGLAVAASKRRT